MPHVSIDWLRDHVAVPEGSTIENVAESLVRVGIEEEQIIPAAVLGPLVAGRVLDFITEDHSNGKAIRYCRVDVGSYNDEPQSGAEPSAVASRGIVCGAHNFALGDTVVVALPGAVLPGPFPIAARKTYGHVSDGMICSERELGLGNDHRGIMILDSADRNPVPLPGTDMIPLLGLGSEVLEVNVTPDRGYCFSVRGLAREYGLSTGAEFTDLGLTSSLTDALPEKSDGAFEVVVDPESMREGRVACDRFVTRIVRNVDPTVATPKWMVQRLEQAGMRSVSMPVDVTNYVMLDLGQPLHAYDLGYVQAPFVVRRAEAGEPFKTLDGSDLVLNTEDVLITDSPKGERGSRIVGLAGVMGGLDSEVTDSTTDIVVEAAHFDPVSIARSARRHRLFSEASKRFERGVDPNLPPVAAARAAALIAEFGGGTVEQSRFDVNSVSPMPAVMLPVGEVARLTALELEVGEVTKILESIGCAVEGSNGELRVVPPSWRPDLVGPAHLVEEVARLYGYDEIPSILPRSSGGQGLSQHQSFRRNVSQTLAASGLVEVKSYPFISDSHDRQQLPASDPRRNTLRLRNPLVEGTASLRTSILDTLLETAERNASRGVRPFAMFELGQVAVPDGTVPAPIVGVSERPSDDEIAMLFAGVPDQPWHVAGVMGGSFAPRSGPELEDVTPEQSGWIWSDALELSEMIGGVVGLKVEATRTWVSDKHESKPGPPLPKTVDDPADAAPWHPARAATLFVRSGKGYVVIGHAGELHPGVVENFGLSARTVAFELNLDRLRNLIPKTPRKVKQVSAYPPAKEDFAVVVDEDVTQAEVSSVMRRAAGPLLESLVLFDIYRGAQVGEGKKSLAYSMTLRSDSKTLEPAEVEATRNAVVKALAKRLGASLRS